jgi:hypothetical protein
MDHEDSIFNLNHFSADVMEQQKVKLQAYRVLHELRPTDHAARLRS